MALHTLEVHIPAQENAIDKISFRLDSTTNWCVAWGAFRNELWGIGLESLGKEEMIRRDESDPLEATHILPDPPPTSRLTASIPETLPDVWDIRSANILVRTEYHEAENAAVSLLSKPSMYVFVVGGQPGIGLLPSLSVTCKI